MGSSVKKDAVNRPSHYDIFPGVQVIDVINHLGLGFHDGNILKYLCRAGRKDPTRHVEDLKKARFYLDDLISLLEK